MSENPQHGWSFESLKALVDERDRRYAVEREMAQRAIEVAEKHAEQWRSNANEWRAAMTDRERQFLSKSMGYIVGITSILALVLTIAEKFR